MDYRQLAIDHLGNIQLAGKTRRQRSFGGIHSEAVILMYIEQKEGVLPKDISDAMGVTTARVAVALNELAEKGLITREIDDSDRRRVIVKLTPKGHELAAEQKQKYIDKMASFFAELGDHDAKEYVRIMSKIAKIMRCHNQ